MGPFFDNRADIIWEVHARERLVNIGIRPSANFIKQKIFVRLETSVCFRITRLMNNQIKSRKKATSPKKEKATTRMLWLFWKVYHNWVVYHKIQMHSFLKVESLGEVRCRKSWNQFKGYDSLSLRYVKRVSGKRKRTIVGKNKCRSSSSAKSQRYEIWGPIPWRDWRTRAMCPKRGLGSCQKQIQAQRERQNYILLVRGRMKRVCDRFRSKSAYGQ